MAEKKDFKEKFGKSGGSDGKGSFSKKEKGSKKLGAIVSKESKKSKY